MKTKKILLSAFLVTALFWGRNLFSQNISVNTSGAANSTSSMFEVLQPSVTDNTIGIFARHSGAATNAYAIWAEATGATNKYAIVVPSGGGNVGMGTSTPVLPLSVISNASSAPLYLKSTGTNDAFSILPWTGVTYLSAGIYYKNGAWVHDAATTSNSLIAINPGSGVLWYDSNNSLASWNVASGVTQWDASGYWKNIVRSTAAGDSYFMGGKVGIGITGPLTALDVSGAYSARYSTGAAAAAVTIPTNVSLFRLTVVAGVTANALTSTTPQDGQFMTIINEDGDPATFAGYTIPANYGVGSFVYSSTAPAGWRMLSLGGSGTGWSILGNAGTVDGTNFLGTTDNIALNFRVNNVASGRINSTGITILGYNAGVGNVSASATAFGYQALWANGGSRATAIGYQALYNNTYADQTAVGYNALYNNQGANNTAVGSNAMGTSNNSTASYITAIGKDALQHTNGTARCTAVGFQALGDENGLTTVTGSDNLAIGYTTLGRLSSGTNNTFVGNRAGLCITTGSDNTALGNNAFLPSVLGPETGSKNIAIGSNALTITGLTGSSNTVIGYSSNVDLAAAANRTAIGANSYVTSDNCMVLGSISGVNGGTANTNVGIGTTTPAEILHVERNQNGKTRISLKNTTAGGNATSEYMATRSDGKVGTFGIGDPSYTGTTYPDDFKGTYIWTNAAAGITFRSDDAAGPIRFVTLSAGAVPTEYMRVAAGGNVGIGCTAPTYKLHVIGDIASSATVRTTNAVATGAITACSDIRFKQGVVPLSDALDNILKLQAVNYFWKTKEFPERNFSDKKQIGFIAQDMEKIYPEVVLTDKDGYKAIDYSKLTPILVEAMKEQQAIIENLKSENEKLKTKSEERFSKLEAEMKLLLQTTKEEAKK